MVTPAAAPNALLPVQYDFKDEADVAVWRVYRLDLSEELSRPYRAVLDLVTQDTTAAVESLVGGRCVLSIRRGEGERRLCGIVSRTERRGQRGHDLMVRVEVVPALALLAHRVDTRIFQNKTIPEIVKEVMEAVLGPLESEVKPLVEKSYVKREYCVQYNESDLAFVSRLMEEEGIIYGFDHSGEREAVQLFDKNDAVGPVVTLDGDAFVHMATGADDESGSETVRKLAWAHQLTSAKFDSLEFDWTRPSAPAKASSNVSEQKTKLPVYLHWQSEFTAAPGNLKDLTTVVDEGFTVNQKIGLGEGLVSGFTPGMTFELMGHDAPELDQKYVITRVHHVGESPEERVEDAEEQGEDKRERYVNFFECVPLDQPWHPPQRTPWPQIHGLVTATVVGPGGEEIHVDSHGRVKVQFHWDRAGKKDDKASCWIRVSQPWGGAGWGHWFVPRIGMEVVVAFVEGDPDRPLIVGSIYNGENPTPYGLPGAKTQSGIRTNSSPGGGGFNEIMFDDAAGSELVYHQAQKDLRIEVKNNKDQHVGANENLKVDGNRGRAIDGNQSLTVGGNDGNTVSGNRTVTVGGNQDVGVGGSLSENISGSHTETVAAGYALTVGAAAAISVGGALAESVGAAKAESIGGAKMQQIGGAKVVTVGGASSETIGGTRSIDVKGELTIEVTKNMAVMVKKDQILNVKEKMTTVVEKDVSLEGKTIKLEGKDEIVLKVGGSHVTIKSGEIVIHSSKITLDASGDVVLKGSKIKAN